MKTKVLKIVLIGFVMLSTLILFLVTQTTADQNERKSVDAVNKEIVRACQERDWDATLALWAGDGVDLLPGLPPMVGKAKISAWLDSLRPQMAGTKMRYCTVDWQDIQIHGDLAYEWGINRQLIDYPPPRKSAPNEGKILFILKRQGDGSWKIALESWNSSPQPQEPK